MARLYYVHDPMCSWCYAFKPVYQKLLQHLPEQLKTVRLLGGLAPETTQPMPLSLQQQLKATWQRIEQKVPDIYFNYDFWDRADQTRPRRSTYPACRAVIAARTVEPESETAMIDGIQQAYYQQAQNPSDTGILIEIAQSIGLNPEVFKAQLNASATRQTLENEITQSRKLNVSSYPSLVIKTNNSAWPISIDYLHYETILDTINSILDFE